MDDNNKVSCLDEKWIFFKKWLQNCIDERGADSTMTLAQIVKMVSFIDEWEKKMDDTLLEAFGFLEKEG